MYLGHDPGISQQFFACFSFLNIHLNRGIGSIYYNTFFGIHSLFRGLFSFLSSWVSNDEFSIGWFENA